MNHIDLMDIQEIINNNNSELAAEIKTMINGSTLDEKALTFPSLFTEKISPRVILELGGGTSTSLFANYLKKNMDTHLISVDNFKYFA